MRLPRIHNWDDILGRNDSKSVCERSLDLLHFDVCMGRNSAMPVLIGSAVTSSRPNVSFTNKTMWAVHCLTGTTVIESDGFE